MSISQPKLTLRRPTLSDKTTILEMIAEFKRAESAMDGGFYQMGEEYENWLEKLQLAEAGLDLPEGFVHISSMFHLMKGAKPSVFSIYDCDSMTSCSTREAILVILSALANGGKDLPRSNYIKAFRKLFPKTFPEF